MGDSTGAIKKVPSFSLEDRILTVDDLARKLQVKPSWIYIQPKSGPGALPRMRIGKYLRFSERAIDEWLAKKSTNN